MNRYFINGQEVTRAQAEEQLKINDEINQITDSAEWLKAAARAKFVFITDENGNLKWS